MTGYDYGRAGTIGIGTPQANPTVEAELRILLPPAVAMAVVRLTSAAADPAARLRAYLEGLDATLAGFDSLRLDAFGFACTGSSYLLGAGREAAIVAEIERSRGLRVVTATAAIAWQLRRTGARRIALATPYPPALAEAAIAFWSDAGFDIVATASIATAGADTRGIYALGSDDARPAVAGLVGSDADAILLSGTGMPSLALIADAGERPPILSSNLCLALRLCDMIGAPPPDPAQWRARLASAITPPEGA